MTRSGGDAGGTGHCAQVGAVLGDIFEALGQADRVRAETRRRAGMARADAEIAVFGPEADARAALRRLRALLGSDSAAVAICALAAGARVRGLLAGTRPDDGSGGAGGGR